MMAHANNPVPALELRGLTKRYDDGFLALDGFDMTVPAGEFFGLLGPNGAGKTTLISAVCNLIRTTGGEIRIFGHDHRVADARRLIGLAEQDINLDRFVDVEETLLYHGGYYGMGRAHAKRRAREMMEIFDLSAKAQTRVPKLSGGMRRRLLIARALMHEPRLLILDEPTAGVDFELRRGEVLGIAGLSGSGREELAAALTGAQPASLTVFDRDGREWHGMTPKRAKQLGLALVLANRHPDAAIGQFSIRENVSLALLQSYVRGGRVRGAEERAAVDGWMESLDIRPHDPDKLYSYLSGGNKQKVILAKWLNTSPTVFVMDDPTSGVDIGARHGIYGLVREQAATGAAFVVCSSDLEDFVGVCDRVLALVGGRVASELSGAEISESRLLQAIVTQTGKDA